MMGFQTFYCKELLLFNSYIISSCYFLLHCCYVALVYEGHVLCSVYSNLVKSYAIKVFCIVSSLPGVYTSFYQEQ